MFKNWLIKVARFVIMGPPVDHDIKEGTEASLRSFRPACAKSGLAGRRHGGILITTLS